MKYIGQTGRPFHVRFNEHFRDDKYANNKSKFAQHPLENRHSIISMENIMDILYATSNGIMLSAMEKFYIYREAKNNSKINDRCTVAPNIIFVTVILKDNARTLAAILTTDAFTYNVVTSTSYTHKEVNIHPAATL
jgi:hypothetical protein